MNNLKILATASIMALSMDIHEATIRTDDKGTFQQINIERGASAEYKISRRDAERSLDVLARNADVEDAWVYTGNKLYDVGTNEDFASVSVSPRRGITLGDDTITIYHNHVQFFGKDFYAPPKPNDILQLALMKQPYRNMTGKVLDGKGIWEFDIDENEVELINKDLGSGLREEKRIRDAIYSFGNDKNQVLYIPSIQSYIDKLSDVGVRIKFTPSDKL